MLDYGFFLDLAIILLAAKIFGILSRKLQLPQVAGILVAGLIIGPNMLGWVKETEFLLQMGELGVIMLMFVAGLETDLKELKNTGLAALCIAAFGVVVPLTGGYLLYSVYDGFAAIGSHEFLKAIFIGVILTATSVSITVETLREMGKLKGKVGTAILSAAIIDDVIGIILLTFVIGFTNPESSGVAVIGNTVAFFVVAIVLGAIIHYIFKVIDHHDPHRRRLPIYGFAVCLLFAYIAEHYFGIADITGAYVAGIVLYNLSSSEYIIEKIDTNSYMLFSPIFFTSIGLKTELTGFTVPVLLFTIAFVIIALASKVVGCGYGAKLMGFKKHDAIKIGVGMMARGEVALIVAQKGLSAGLMDPVLFSAVIMLVILSSIATPIILKVLYAKDEKNESLANETEINEIPTDVATV
ncbi:cation:proton antiporter [Candidatus Epulonipiscium viviparus]|uniref:cation:proton antiporter n=1 Tax=Candidatus Epulonipiscium viviparus TaxID=420336 RepID=UPI00016C0C4F|nr:cation:proton antiporter [Candidatus Epulopiscium viviparus]